MGEYTLRCNTSKSRLARFGVRFCGLILLVARIHAAEPAPAERCPAASFDQCVQWCRDQYVGPDEKAKRFACFDSLEQTPAVPASVPAPSQDKEKTTQADSPLRRLWTEPETIGFEPYQQSYLLVTDTDDPNSAPTSPNPDNRVPFAYGLQHVEIKFQFSLKAVLLPSKVIGYNNSLWFGYTQQSYWQAFDASHSRPFRESNYEPELIFSHGFGSGESSIHGWSPVFLNFGLQHQSNGQSDPRSRSWNRAYAQLGMDDQISTNENLAVLIRPWWRFKEDPAGDNNPDISHYLGYGDVECLYWHGDHLFSVLLRARALQADVSTPLLFLNQGRPKARSLQLHLQLFTGYGESLVDYNQRHTTFGVGVSVPYGL
jgi:phospholipase A1